MNRTAKIKFSVYNSPGMSMDVVKEVSISNEFFSKAQSSSAKNDPQLSAWAKQFFPNAHDVKVQSVVY